jgi:hypothetical protein
VKKRKATTRGITKDPKKEQEFSVLAEELRGLGFTVRRENLKRGHGWKAVSGCCTANGERLIFVDRTLSQDDQIAFLMVQLANVKAQLANAAPDTEENSGEDETYSHSPSGDSHEPCIL